MVIIETKIFSKQIERLLNFEDYKEFQIYLIENPECGDIIKGSGGIRKVRWNAGNKGKSGGIRVLYYWVKTKSLILMLLAYSKNEKDNLTVQELKILKKLVKEEFENEKRTI